MGRVVPNAIPHRVERRQEVQGQDRGDKETAHHRKGHGSPEHFSGDRYQPENRLVDTSWLALEVFDTADKTVRY